MIRQIALMVSMAMALLVTVANAEVKVFLVSVGVADYPGKSNDLRLPAKDAQAMQWLYNKTPNATTRLLVDSKATKSNIIQTMNSVFCKAGRTDIVVLFFSGHGTKSGLVAYDGILSFSEIRKSFAKCTCQNKMIFADACFSGKFRQGASSQDSGHKSGNVMLFLSSRSNEYSIERPTMKNGLFTAALMSGLRGRADANRDRTITAKELYTYVSADVAQKSANKQHPVMWGNFSNNMPVVKW